MSARMTLMIALAGGLAIWHFAPSAQPGVDKMTSASVGQHDSNEFAITNLMSKTACIAKRGDVVSSRSRSFVADGDCETVWPGLATVKNWTENEDGSVVLTNGRGEQVLTISVADGVDYEVLDPVNALVTLTSIQ